MEITEAVRHFGLPVAAVAASAGYLLVALFQRGTPAAVSRNTWLMSLSLLILAGDAAFGAQRPIFERRWKGSVVALLMLALAVTSWRHHRYQRRSRSEAPPRADQPTGSTRPAAGDRTLLTMPTLGDSVTEGTITRWLKQVGDTVEAGEPLLEVSTDKVDTELPAPAGGTLLEIKVAEHATVPIGAALAVIGAP